MNSTGNQSRRDPVPGNEDRRHEARPLARPQNVPVGDGHKIVGDFERRRGQAHRVRLLARGDAAGAFGGGMAMGPANAWAGF
jgi:hypothetical protein